MSDEPLNEPQSEDDFETAFAQYAGGKASEEPADETPPEAPGEEHADEEAQGHSIGREDETEPEPEDDVSKRLAALEAENEKLKHSEASQRGRLGAYQKQINALQRELQERQNTPQAVPEQDNSAQRQEAAEAAGVEDWEALKSDFPEVAKALDARLESEKSRIEADRQRQAQLEQRLAELQNAVQPIQQQAQDQYLRSQMDALSARHPDWREVVSAPEFAEWLNQQPPSLRKLTESDDAAEAAALMDLYKSQRGAPEAAEGNSTDRRQERLASAQSVPRRGAAPKSGAPDDFEAAFNHYAKRR
ncbi:hypothetical protein [Spiribacter onubensis]|uniref:Uncharacterized protein n=1 Tax=Spiribacter onubensis TaxID=3122420 RepID=A0ABV3S8R5_9GAMM